MKAFKLLLLLAGCGCARPGLAQRTPVAPLSSGRVVAQPEAPARLSGVPIRSAAASASVATAPPGVRAAEPGPVFIINGRYLGTLSGVNPQRIAAIEVHRGANVPAKWRSLADRGILTITLKTNAKLRAKSLAALGRGLALRGPVSFLLEGLPISDTSLRVISSDIAALEITRLADHAVVNIRLVGPAPVVHPPGTIMIRGVANR